MIAGRRDRISHTSELVALDRDICFFPGSWRIDGTVAPANPDMQGCQRVYRQEGCLSPGEHSLTMYAWGMEYGTTVRASPSPSPPDGSSLAQPRPHAPPTRLPCASLATPAPSRLRRLR